MRMSTRRRFPHCSRYENGKSLLFSNKCLRKVLVKFSIGTSLFASILTVKVWIDDSVGVGEATRDIEYIDDAKEWSIEGVNECVGTHGVTEFGLSVDLNDCIDLTLDEDERALGAGLWGLGMNSRGGGDWALNEYRS